MPASITEHDIKTCSCCGLEKPYVEYAPRPTSKDGFRGSCKSCDAERARRWAAKNPEKRRASTDAWQARNPEKTKQIGRDYYNANKDKSRANSLWALYRLTLEEWEKISAYQEGLCPVCCRPSVNKRLSTDHCHSTGLIRGLLCWKCNYALGIIQDDVQRLKNLIAYLENPPATIALGGPRYGMIGKAKTGKRKTLYGSPNGPQSHRDLVR